MKHEITTALVVCQGESIPRISSQTIAQAFNKKHTNVLRRIKELASKCPEDFNQLNFESVEYEDAKGQWRPQYLLTRDAFSLLVMGFTGPEALAWKLRYINAFNQMEQQLLSQRLLAAPEGRALISQGVRLARRLTPERRREIKQAVHYKGLGLNNTEISRLLVCCTDKVRGLLLDHELIQGGAK